MRRELILAGLAALLGSACPAMAQTAEGPVRPMLGEMVYLADAARFTECRTGEGWPIAMEAAFPQLQAAYMARRAAPGASLAMALEGSVADRPRMDGAGAQLALVVRRVIGAFPGLDCERARAEPPLEETLWRLVALGGEPLPAAEGGRAPSLQLRRLDGQRRLLASAGCNRIGGTYAIETGTIEAGGRIALTPGAMTRMACPPPLDAVEQRLIGILGMARQWRILGPTLELRDAGGATLATFEALFL